MFFYFIMYITVKGICNMNESILPNNEYIEQHSTSGNDFALNNRTAPFFSMRKLRVIYNELVDSTGFEYSDFDSFKYQVLNSTAPQLELNRWQSIAARR